ncbi:hypothetical protein BTR14_06335 [Rhizobium rhizosphaerae]|uniref:DUF2254 domain-containing protein n=1 Tax=Xaviernesmea rhizosphaerae TaxID=1672749 RepID=A0ABX3PEX6_9HYPH|nr:DUF2254 domain-containing protein [Xaviernesmea rhizosphaerae]OQP87056.1 hypothetical protein BTR14_06335 [Xaviernesmea rhizosphaerae]
MRHWSWLFERVAKRLWVRASLYCLAGMATALAGLVLGRFIPSDLSAKLGADSVGSILTIIGSSMLTVTTFSLSTLVAATASAASGGTPRATTLLLEDETAQRALSTFLGAFLFSLVGLIALRSGLYDDGGRFVLFAATLLLVALITLTLLRWIDHLTSLGRVGETIARVEAVALKEIAAHRDAPFLGGRAPGPVAQDASWISPEEIGHILHLDMGRLQALGETHQARIHVLRRPGALAGPGQPILAIEAGTPLDAAAEAAFREGFVLGARRSFKEDPRFGLVVLAEIGMRAHSAAVNDPGTAIDVLTALTRLLSQTAPRQDREAEIRYDRVFVPAITAQDLFEDAFLGMARDGAGNLEFSIRLQKAMALLAAGPDAEIAAAARRLAREAAARSLEVITFEPDRQRLLAVCARGSA